MTHEEIIMENFDKVSEWIKQTFPHAIQQSYLRKIECSSLHHVYHTAFIRIDSGEVFFVRGSHGWEDGNVVYSADDHKWYNNKLTKEKKCNIVILEEFLHEWHQQKAYIEMTLQPYEDMYNFNV